MLIFHIGWLEDQSGIYPGLFPPLSCKGLPIRLGETSHEFNSIINTESEMSRDFAIQNGYAIQGIWKQETGIGQLSSISHWISPKVNE
jgi:hypothetical protein